MTVETSAQLRPTLHWFSPLPPAKTGIADYTAQILPYLSERADVVLWTDQDEYDKSLERYGPVHHYDSRRLDRTTLRLATGADGVPIYHVGNNGPLHKSIWEASQKVPGITVLHDTRLQHLFAHVIRDCYKNADLYLRVMKQYYGNEGLRWATRFLAGGSTTEDMAAQFPLVRLAAAGSVAAIVHSEESREVLQAEGYPGAIYLPFPYASQAGHSVRSNEPPFRIVICGYLGPNRRIDSFLRALGAFPEKDKFRVEVYGPVWDPAYINRILEDEHLTRQVTLHGFQPISELDRALAGADLAVNLRFPTMGEASMSQLQLWDHGIPSMVTPVGWYGRAPEGTVLFVRIDHEIEDIHTHLSGFLRNPDAFRAIGDRARETLRSKHNPVDYAEALTHYAGSLPVLAARRTAFELADRVGAELRSWNCARSLQEITATVADEICALTSGR